MGRACDRDWRTGLVDGGFGGPLPGRGRTVRPCLSGLLTICHFLFKIAYRDHVYRNNLSNDVSYLATRIEKCISLQHILHAPITEVVCVF
jgi:hypothetical protein